MSARILKRLKLKICLLAAGLLMILSFFGCAKQEEEENLVVIDNSEDNTLYGLVTANRDDVILSQKLTVTYMQINEQEVSFKSGGKKISKVYVEEGDAVKAGDPLIMLSSDNLQERIDELEYRISKNELELKHLDTAEAFDLQDAYNNFVYNTREIEEEDIEKYEKNKASIGQGYRYKREDLNDEIEFDKKQLNKIKNELNGSVIRSTLSGTVHHIKDDLEGSTSKKDEVVMTLVDDASGLFEMEEPDFVSYFHEGESVPMSIVYGTASGEYELIPHAMGSWGEKQQFEVLSGPDNDGIDIGTTGTVTVVLDRKDDVISLPLGAVYHADGKPYVYMLDENNFRQMVYVETGLEGDEKIEIISGVGEGEQVVYK
ncbi:MAG: biotin/lipoyl-binding protein [Lachnospiraceae bacterium]|nr:biotin/lipoyl-binding protein [Lachnospiraceae bacterium]